MVVRPQEHLGRAGRRSGCSTRSATSSISPTIARSAAAAIVFLANDRCNQENLIDQLKHGVGATPHAGGHAAEQLGVHGDDRAGLDAEGVVCACGCRRRAAGPRATPPRRRPCCAWNSKRFCNAFMLIPVQVVRTSRRLVFRLLAWNPWQAVFLRGFDQLLEPLRC